jgi:hypothetical protein
MRRPPEMVAHVRRPPCPTARSRLRLWLRTASARAVASPTGFRRTLRDIGRRSVRVRRNRSALRFASPSSLVLRNAIQHGPRASARRGKSGAAGGRAPCETRGVSSRDRPKLPCRYWKGSVVCLQTFVQAPPPPERYVCNVRLVVAPCPQQESFCENMPQA